MERPTSESQTKGSFAQKWSFGSEYFLEATLDENSDIQNWILSRNGIEGTSGLTEWLSNRKTILDAGCGNGRVTSLLSRYSSNTTRVVGVDFAANEIASRNLADDPKITVQFGDLLEDLTALGKFDLIYCQEVLHHTTDPFHAFRNLRSLLEENGEIAIYVYKKKAVLREFADDYIRDKISHLTYEQSHEAIKEITEFAREVSKLSSPINFPGIESLGVKAQEATLHRFIYNNFFKTFWNDQLTFEENFSINFDWYHPQLCSRHTKDEVEGWFIECGLSIVHSLEDDFGITVRGVSRKGNHVPSTQ